LSQAWRTELESLANHRACFYTRLWYTWPYLWEHPFNAALLVITALAGLFVPNTYVDFIEPLVRMEI
jgi:hypothetical protein